MLVIILALKFNLNVFEVRKRNANLNKSLMLGISRKNYFVLPGWKIYYDDLKKRNLLILLYFNCILQSLKGSINVLAAKSKAKPSFESIKLHMTFEDSKAKSF